MVAATLEHILAEIEAPEQLAKLLSAKLEKGWPPGEYDKDAQEFFRDRMTKDGKNASGWYGWYAIRLGNSGELPVLMGAGGYFGPPDAEGVVEIGFSVMPGWRGKGYATELAELLIENAFADKRVKRIIAHTTPANLASRKVLENCGFRYVSEEEESSNCLFEILRNTNL